MNREKMNDAFSQVGAGEELRRSVMEMKVEEKHTVKWNGKKLAVRLASLAAAVAVMVGLFFLPGPPVVVPDPDSTGQTQVVQKPLLGIRVHAEEGVIDLGEERDGPILAGEESTDADGDLGLFYKPYEVKIFNTETGEWELYHKKETERMPKIDFEISWEGLEEYHARIKVIANGEEVDLSRQREDFNVGWIGYADRGVVGWLLSCSLTEEKEVEIIVYDADTNQTIRMVKMHITPAFYEKQTEGGDSIDPSIGTTNKNEGYMVEVLEEFMIDLTKEE